MKIFIAFLGAIAVFWGILQILPGFRHQKPEDYKDTSPPFDLKKHLGGEMLSEGIIYGPMGKVAAKFVATMSGEWEGDTGTLREEFTYENGNSQSRQWTMSINPDGTLKVTAPDVIGEGKGIVSGATLKLTYRLKLTEAAGGHVLDVVDWLYLTDSGVIMNKSEMRKYGIKVAELVANIRPVE